MIRITIDVDTSIENATDWVTQLFFAYPAFLKNLAGDIEIKDL